VTDKSIANALKEVGKVDVLDVRINSGGGSVFDAFSIFTQLRKFDAKIVTIIEGLAASAAAFISQAGDEREMSGNALFMNHESSGFAFGNKKDVEKLKVLLEKIDSILEKTLVKTSNQTLKEIRELMENETFLSAEEALEKGFIDNITDDSDVEPHVHPEDRQKNTEKALEEIYKRHMDDFKKDATSFDDITKLVENELAPDNFSVEPFRLSGEFDYSKLSISNLPCVDNGVVNINGLRYLKARLPVTPLESEKNREDVKTWINLTESKFDAEKNLGKYRDDKLPFRIVLKVDIAGKPQTFIQTEENIQMNALFYNSLGVEDESQVLDAMAKLKDLALASGVAPVASVDPPIIDPVSVPTLPAAIRPTGDRTAKIEIQLAQILTQNATLIAEGTRKDDLLAVSIGKVEEVLQFKNQSILDKRKKVIDGFFYDSKQLNPVQHAKALKDFVEIEAKLVPDTESLFNLSVDLFKTNAVNEKMEYLRGGGGKPEIVEDAQDKYDKALDAIIKEKGWDPDSENDLTKAMAILEEKNPELAQSVVEDSKVRE